MSERTENEETSLVKYDNLFSVIDDTIELINDKAFELPTGTKVFSPEEKVLIGRLEQVKKDFKIYKEKEYGVQKSD